MNVIPRKIIRVYKIHIAIILFLFLFMSFHYIKPGFAYMENGAYRQFGVGYRHKTVLPVWLFSIVLAIVSYLFVLILLNNM